MPTAAEGLRFHDRVHGPSAAYTIPFALRLRGPLDVALLREALGALAERHPVLRREGDEACLIDVSPSRPREREAEARRVATALVRVPIDPDRATCRTHLVRLGERDHVLVWPIHHLAADGASLRILQRDLLALYAGDAASLPELSPPAVADDRAAADLAYWAERLAGVPDVHGVPTDRPRPAISSGSGVTVHRKLAAGLLESVERFARAKRVTPFVIYSAALHAVLARWSGGHDGVLGFAAGGRDSAAVREAVGLFAATLVQRVDMSDDPTGDALVERTRAAIADALRHDRVRFEALVGALGLGGRLDRHPVFQVLIDYFGAAAEPGRAGSLRAEALLLDTATSRFDLELSLRLPAGGNGIDLALKADAALFDATTAAGMLAAFVALLDDLVAHPATRLSALRLHGEAGEAEALRRGTGPARDYDLERTLDERIVAALRAAPGRGAVRCDGATISAGELDRRSALVAAALAGRGVADGIVVASCLPRSIAAVVGPLGILRAGGAYLPLDPDDPPERLRALAGDARPALVLATAETAPLLAGAAPQLLLEPGGEPEPSASGRAPAAAEPSARPSSALAYVIYTSGSSGRPKAVAVAHRAVVNRLLWMRDDYAIGPGDVVLHKTAPGFDVSLWELFLPLAAGALLLVAKPGGHRDPEYLGDLIAADGVTVVHFVPSALRGFALAGGLRRCGSVRCLVASGEALGPDLRDTVLAGFPGRLINLYGPTEAAIDVTAHECRRDDPDPGTYVPIGRPVANTVVVAVDSALRAVGPGIVGELALGGVQLADGYRGQPELTAQRFVTAPGGMRLYRTGDLGRVSADGTIAFLGRIDDQIKVRGRRIEPAEIEAAMNAHPGVAASVAVLDRDRDRLVAYVVAFGGAFDLDGLREDLAARLPDAMVPRAFAVLSELPLLASGKIDRRRLPAVAAAPPPVPRAVPPRGPVEEALAAAWHDVLGEPAADAERSFFRSGGDSIRSIELVAAARRRGWAVAVADVFSHPTIAALARVAHPVEDEDDTPAPFALAPAGLAELDVEDAYPLSTLLAGLVSESLVNPAYRVYVTSLRVRGPFAPGTLRAAAGAVIARYPFLRSSVRFAPAGEPLQIVHRTVPDPVRIVEPPGPDGALAERLHSERETPFDWTVPPLLRITAYRAHGGFQLTLAEPFLDGWSATLVLTAILDAYEALLDGRPPPLPELDRAFPSHVRRERLGLANAEARAFWARRLDGLEPARLPRLAPGAPDAYLRLDVPIPPETADRLLALADDLGVGLKSVLLAAHVHAVATLTGKAYGGTGLMANARPETDAGARAVGLFLNVNPLAVPLPAGSWRDLVRAVHAAEAEMLPHRGYPYAVMLRDAGARRPFETVFNFTHFAPYRRTGRLTVDRVDASDQTYFPLTAQFRGRFGDGAPELALEFALRDLAADQPAAIAARYAETLAELAAGPARAHGARPAPALGAYPVAPSETLWGLFEAQVTRTPGSVALWDGGAGMTYAELDRRARSVAGALAPHAGRGDRVCVVLPRSFELVATMLAVLRIGATYVPLDAALPPARLRELAAGIGGAVAIGAAEDLAHLPAGMPAMAIGDIPPEGDAPPYVPDPGAPAYAIFTSGSTGRPKAACVPQQAVVNRLRWGWNALPFAPGERIALKTPIAFVDAFAETFTGLLRGVPGVIVGGAASEPDRLVAALANGAVTRVTLVPSMLAEMLRLPGDLGARLPRLVHWTLSGEPLPAALARSLLARVPHARILNLYGSTEVAGDATAYAVAGDEPGATIPIGEPIDGVRAYVIDELGNLADPGVEGELAIGGNAVGTGSGYLDDPELTAAHFAADPFGPAGSRLYRTGDLVVRHPGGPLCYLGRLDRQIKVGGVRLEPAEIEAALCGLPGIAAAVVAQRPGPAGTMLLVAYVEPVDEAALRPQRLRAALRERLPAAAVPDAFVAVFAWPRTPSGKIDARALPSPVAAAEPAERAPTALERELAGLWELRLGIAAPEPAADFFALGGGSLRAIMLAASIGERFGVDFSLTDVFDHPTLAEQAALVAGRLEASIGSAR